MHRSRALYSIHKAKKERTIFVQDINSVLNNESWVFVRVDEFESLLNPTEWYWIFMKNADTPTIFTTIPL